MTDTLQIQTEVLPGGKIEVEAPELREGERVTVTVSRTNAPQDHRRTVLEVLDSLPGHPLFETPQDADRYLCEERDSWDA